MSVAPRLTARQAQVLDACRHGATARDLCSTIAGMTRGAASAQIRGLAWRGLLTRVSLDGIRWTYTLTATGKAAWLNSLK